MRDNNNEYKRHVEDKFTLYEYTLQFTDKKVLSTTSQLIVETMA